MLKFTLEPKVCTTMTIPGMNPRPRHHASMVSRAAVNRMSSSFRSHRKMSHSLSGIVQTIWRYGTSTNFATALSIQASVAIVPQEEQNRDLQEWGTTRSTSGWSGHRYRWYPDF